MSSIVTTLEVIFGLGMLIFIHELGHFVVAKACGVKCEKFYLGFDIYGLKLLSFRRGETEYGIGILPLGGYVKMLGQDDNPARAAEERERSKLGPGDEGHVPLAGEALDPRSYLAQSVPERMAIISAGVIMNLILAFFMAAGAYWLGVKEAACGISETIPGEAAWKADLWPGDRITAINSYAGNGHLTFEDLLNFVVVGRQEDGVRLQIERRGVAEPIMVTIFPEIVDHGSRGRPTIGVLNSRSTRLLDGLPADRGSPAFEALQLPITAAALSDLPAMTVVAVDRQPTPDYRAIHEALAVHAAEPLTVTIARQAKDSQGDLVGPVTQSDVVIAPNPLRTLGVAMEMGPITAIQDHSPAEAAGLEVGDVLQAVDDEPIFDPQRLPELLARRADQRLRLTVERKQEGETRQVPIDIVPRQVHWFEHSGQKLNSPWSAPALGVTYRILPFVAHVEPNSPAAQAQWTGGAEKSAQPGVEAIAPGTQIVVAEILPAPVAAPGGDALEIDDSKHPFNRFEFTDDEASWPVFFERMQQMSPHSKVRLTLADRRQAEMTPVNAPDWFSPERGLNFAAETVEVRARSLADALSLAFAKTKESSLLVYKFLRALTVGQVSSKNLGGPGTIFVMAQANAQSGLAKLLMFLTVMSANLAVINMLPIPVLDGGHMMFLIYEGLRGKPPNEKVHGILTWLGLGIVLFLLIYTNGLDIARLVSWLHG